MPYVRRLQTTTVIIFKQLDLFATRSTMKNNAKIMVLGRSVILVPYRKCHVLRYHEWMKSEELQKLTASEPLTLEEEYKMQQSWADDENKCTFIILDADLFDTSHNEIESMVGDVNLFLTEENSAEVEIMIAEPQRRGKGMGKEATLAMMSYGMTELNLQMMSVKIGYDNEKSINMFQKFGFQEVSRSDAFEEVTMELPITDSAKSWLHEQTEHLKTVPYDGS